MAHPELETMEQALSRKAESGMQGIYPSTEKLSNVLGAKGMYQIICNAWALAKDHIPDYMPDEVRTRYADPTARRLLQHPFPAVARTAAAGTVQAEIRRNCWASSSTSSRAARSAWPKTTVSCS